METFILLFLYETLIWRMYPIKENIAESSIVHRYYLFVSASEGFMFTEINRKILLGILFVTSSSKEEIRKERRF